MKKLIFVICLLSIANITSLAHARTTSYDARTRALSGAGVAAGTYSDTFLNPALGAAVSKDDKFHISANIGTFLLDTGNIYDNIERFDAFLDNDNLDLANAQKSLREIQKNSGKYYSDSLGGGITVLFPSEKLSVAVTLSNNTQIFGKTTVADGDFAKLVAGFTEANIGTLESKNHLSGFSLSELGVNFATNFLGINWGVKPKVQLAVTGARSVNIASSDSDNIFLDPKNHFAFNVDVGAQIPLFKTVFLGVSGTNLIPYDFQISETQSEFGIVKMRPQLTVGAGVRLGSLLVEVNVDTLKGWDVGRDIQLGQFVRTGIEFGNKTSLFSIRGGYAYDISNLESDIVSLGAGVRILNMVSLDAAGEYALDGGYGGSLSVGVEF